MMRPKLRPVALRPVALVVLVALLAATHGAGQAGAGSVDPVRWPSSAEADADLDTTAHSLRVSGPSRYDTNLATALLLRGKGGWPFSSPDHTAAGGWWGLGACPFSIIVVASDSPADALAATSLSDPTDQSHEPVLVRSASADPTFDPVGQPDRVDTDTAPIVVTESARRGATGLSPTAARIAGDLAAGGCTTAREAIVVGGAAAVPGAVDQQLVDLGYREVFRVAGADRFATAARLAVGLGTAPIPEGATCTDSSAEGGTAGGFHAGSVVELHTSATECRLLGRTVVLADGLEGADAMAAGWWTSFFQVPVLLTGRDGSLPEATAAALRDLDARNLVVLGGTERIPPATAAAAAEAAGGAAVERIAGPDRYATAVEMAKRVGGWWPTGDGHDAASSMVCVVASGRGVHASRGWPDALSAGPWCGAAHLAAHGEGPPRRLAPPANGPQPYLVPRTAAHHAVPILLVDPGDDGLPSAVADFLGDVFTSATDWCSSTAVRSGCAAPGFVVAFGGPAVLPVPAVRAAATVVSGHGYTDFADLMPVRHGGFHTALDLAPVYGAGGADAASRACFPRGALHDVRWLTAHRDLERTELAAAHDVVVAGRYHTDADGTTRTPGTSAPVCLRFPQETTEGGGDLITHVLGLSLSGHPTTTLSLDYRSSRRLRLSSSVVQAGTVRTEGAESQTDRSAEVTTWQWRQAPATPVTVHLGDAEAPLDVADITITLTRGDHAVSPTAPDRIDGAINLTTPSGTVTATLDGEAILQQNVWRLAGVLTVTGGSWTGATGRGGFVANIDTKGAGNQRDDITTWRLDALL